MSIQVKIAKDIKREGVLINPNVGAGDIVKKDKDGKITDVIKGSNIISTGVSSRAAAKKVYGKI